MGSAAEAATIDLVAAYREEDFGDKVRNLELTMDFLQQDKDSHFTAKRTEDQIKLLAIQRELELNVDGQVKYIDMSLADTLHSLVALEGPATLCNLVRSASWRWADPSARALEWCKDRREK